jgi:hypothetical protein
MKTAFLLGVAAGLTLLAGLRAKSQILPSADAAQAETLRKGQIVAKNIQTAFTEHIVDDPTFGERKQLPEEKQTDPKVLALKDGFLFDWTPGEEARYLMEKLRQGVHALQSVDKPRGFDVVALSGAREFWPKLRDISCHETPGVRYYDLDGFEQYCPTK